MVRPRRQREHLTGLEIAVPLVFSRESHRKGSQVGEVECCVFRQSASDGHVILFGELASDGQVAIDERSFCGEDIRLTPGTADF